MRHRGTTVMATTNHHHHHHQITKLSHSINAIGPAPHRSGKKREHRSIVFATITHISSLHKIRRNAPRYHPTNPLATPNIIRNKTQQLDRWQPPMSHLANGTSAVVQVQA
jgi:hypothetical protein